ncbi:hypothetical protein [Phaeocystidibacter marisrubri]|uniref:Uncharacterized protein n=1 Tax=Phaeocystidibacter marisrubri TaxID=1577780 RepID=A0A6L3ZCP0_9FLAO|nr:hypothetical protein [Phaeocystidibacter marisrubri]KAB2814949.1 hypothetical protein F8C82_14705 [Phaeocystidibacter marisrubri]GGH78029.1 hypothetical protein GCM10011318_28690 [Phaeocystidibacter marisrubri]
MNIIKKSIKIDIEAVPGLPTDRALTGQEIMPGTEVYIDLENSETYFVIGGDPARTYRYDGVAIPKAIQEMDKQRQAHKKVN